MKSAYLLLGVPGNASREDIDLAYGRAQSLFSRERLATEDGALDRLNELKAAYAILSDPASRAAHDRKLAAAPGLAAARAPRAPVEVDAPSPLRNVLVVALLVVALLFAGGLYVSNRKAEARKAQAALELAEKQKAEREEQERAREAERLEAERAAAKAKQDADERRFAMESQQAARAAGLERERQERLAHSVRQADESRARMDEQRRAMEERQRAAESRMQTERDKRSVRELCWQLYRRTDC